MTPAFQKNTWIEIDLGILSRNIRSLRQALAHTTATVFVVKSNAYGHGLIPVSRCAWECGVRWFAVVHMDEALALRALLPGANVLILSAIEPSQVAQAIEAELTPVLVSENQAISLAAAAAALGRPLTCHLKIDTGMGRLGILWRDAISAIPRLAQQPGLRIRGICTHFASAGSEDGGFTEEQSERFRRAVRACEAVRLTGLFRHASNSGAILSGAGRDLDGVRPGILLYGYGPRVTIRRQGPADTAAQTVETQPFLQWKTRVVQVKKVPAGFPVGYDSTYVTARETGIATLDVGYADGYARLLGNRAEVIIRGRRCPVVGLVTMNLITVDLGPACEAGDGDEAVLLGRQGDASIWADEMARWRSTIPYEVLTNIHTSEIRVTGAAL